MGLKNDKFRVKKTQIILTDLAVFPNLLRSWHCNFAVSKQRPSTNSYRHLENYTSKKKINQH